MMSVNELFYGNQTTSTPTWILSTAAPGPLSYYNGMNPYYGAYSTYFNNYAPSRYEEHGNHSRGNRQNSFDDSYDHAYGESNSNSKRQDSSDRSRQQQAGGQQGQNNRRNSSSGWTQDSSSHIHDQPQQRGRDRTSNSSDLYGGSNWDVRRPSKVVELKVPLCCEACEDRVTGSLMSVEGVESVQCDQYKRKVVVRGSAPPATVLKVCKKLFKRSEIIDGARDRKDNTSSNYVDNMR